jgi:hypothetical protein
MTRQNGQVSMGGIIADLVFKLTAHGNRIEADHISIRMYITFFRQILFSIYTPSPAEAEFDDLTAGLGTIQLYP